MPDNKDTRVQATIAKDNLTMADHVIEALAAQGVTHIFGYAGAAIMPLTAAISRHPSVTWVLMRNEAAASLAASAHAKLTGKLSVCMATSGPGTTNLITGLLDAQTDAVPVLAITGQVQTWRQGRFEFQDIDTARVLADLLPYSAQCDQPNQLPSSLLYCINRAQMEKCVVHLSIAADVQSYVPKNDEHVFESVHKLYGPYLHVISEDAVEEAATDLNGTRKVIIAVGDKARGSGPAIEALATRLGAPIVTTFGAKGVIDESHPNSLGVLGIFGAPGDAVAQEVVSASDTIIAFGLREPAPFVADSSGLQIRRLIQCAPTTAALSRRFTRAHSLLGPLDQLAARIADKVCKREQPLLAQALASRDSFLSQWSEKSARSREGTVHPLSIFSALNSLEADFDTFCLDIGDNAVWAAQFLSLTRRQNYVVSDNLGTMGFALPASIAAKLNNRNAKVIAIAGDGGIQMTLPELGTAVQHGLSMTIVVLVNGLLGRIAAAQHGDFGATLHNPDFVAVARAFGGDGIRVDKPQDLISAFKKSIAHEGSPFLIEVRCDPEALAPMSAWHDAFTPAHFS